MKKSSQMALGGIVTSLSTVLNILAAIVPTAGYVFPAFAGMLILITVFESSYKLGIMVYVSSSLLSLLLCTEKFPAIAFLSILGFYPILKLKVDSLPIKWSILKLAIKAAVFNVSIIANFWFSVKLFGMPEEALYVFDIYVPQVLLIVANVLFLMYDKCVDNFIIIYINKLQQKLRNIMNL